MQITKIRKETTSSTWQDIADLVRQRNIQTILQIGDELTVEHSKFGTITLIVLDFNYELLKEDTETTSGDLSPSMTVQFRDLVLPPMSFDEDGSNSWGESSIRIYLNGEEFIKGFETAFRECLGTAVKSNYLKDDTEDKFWLPSLEEIGEPSYEDDNQPDTYAFYKKPQNRIKCNPRCNSEFYWLRSANRGYANYTWYVGSAGGVYYSYAYNAARCAPACVIC